ncbi:chemotaxis protein CheV [Aliikangiella coralliicola]|uniref:Chemotaxis protein CheV n=1 Tax=Aliikangiella coralliicola TaxID=2592383 RepID=A0A545U5X6_9GAMM|nr:chemotaxis protein CheV [Aliikangiella coralliicola]TQV84875.1 chemotaxis protein CheV [Aliikangiella coralliicola]
MSSILDSVNQRTQMVGQNRLELLLFRLKGKQVYGINVFKVREVLQCPELTELPQRNPVVRGVAHIRGMTISVIDLSLAVGGPSLGNVQNCFVVIAEYNRKVQGFLVNSVERIVNMNWSDIHPPPKGSGKSSYLTAVTDIGGQLVEIIDVEKVLAEITPNDATVSAEIVEEQAGKAPQDKVVLIADDSSVARGQIKRTIEQLGFQTKLCKDGKEALEYLEGIVANGQSVDDEVLLLISDIEMPEMDGYTLTAEIRGNDKLSHMWVMLHTSLSGVFNEAMVQKVGANDFIPKFNPDELAQAVQKRMELED